MKKNLLKTACSLLLAYGVSVTMADEASYPSLTLNTGASYSFRKIINSTTFDGVERGNAGDSLYKGKWVQGFGGGFTLKAQMNERLMIQMNYSAGISHYVQTYLSYYSDKLTRNVSNSFNAFGTYAMGNDAGRRIADVTAGYFGFNYCPDFKDLGGYLLKSGTYPGTIYSGGAGKSYLGFKLHSDYIENWQQNLILNAELDYPFLDWSLTYVFDYDIRTVFNFGAGIVFNRLIAANHSRTYPAPSYGVRYSFAGQKAAVRFRFDPKPLFGATDFFGAEDLKLYAEAAILGLKSYPQQELRTRHNDITGATDTLNFPVGYDTLKHRMPVMVGLNLPTHPVLGNGVVPMLMFTFLSAVNSADWRTRPGDEGNPARQIDVNAAQAFAPAKMASFAAISLVLGGSSYLLEKITAKKVRLDLIAFEMEYYGSPYRNPTPNKSPLPQNWEEQYHKDDWRWAFIMNKRILDRITFNLTAASDHYRQKDFNGWDVSDEFLRSSTEWTLGGGIGVGF